jgi:outer membrane protein assembly factor BamA
MIKKILIAFFLLLFIGINAQEDSLSKKEKIKKGFNLAGIPIVAFDQDQGFKYGLATNLYHFGDGSNYPNYDHSLFLEWSRTTKGGNRNLLIYDGLKLIPKTRVTFTLGYLTEQALHFYGFNGYQSLYNSALETTDSDDYISRMYYRHSRKLFISSIDFQGKMGVDNLKWLAGISYYNIKLESVDIEKLNEGQETENLLPFKPLLYDEYITWGVIPSEQAKGGNVSYLKLGAIFDTRDNEANPNKGIWSEALIITAPKFALNDYAYTKLSLTHRQYFTLLTDKLSLAYRLSYHTKIAGEIPFYVLPFIIDSKNTREGLGGAKTLRGILSNRVVGDGVAFANIEMRSKLFKKVILNQNFYLGFNIYSDMGFVTQPYKLSYTQNTTPTDEDHAIDNSLYYQDESMHISYGAGFYFVINNNFVIAMDYGLAADKADGKGGLYIGLNYLF